MLIMIYLRECLLEWSRLVTSPNDELVTGQGDFVANIHILLQNQTKTPGKSMPFCHVTYVFVR